MQRSSREDPLPWVHIKTEEPRPQTQKTSSCSDTYSIPVRSKLANILLLFILKPFTLLYCIALLHGQMCTLDARQQPAVASKNSCMRADCTVIKQQPHLQATATASLASALKASNSSTSVPWVFHRRQTFLHCNYSSWNQPAADINSC